jgi:Lon protease-like protein
MATSGGAARALLPSAHFAAAPPARCRAARRGAPVRCQSGPDGQGDESLRDQARRLDRLFRASDPAPPAAAAAALGGGGGAGLLRDLPLWRVQWAVLPSFQEVIHVHVPHYCAMLASVIEGPRPWRFGHLYLPGGSDSLGEPQFALEAGSQAPLVGTLMEIVQAVRFPDGRLLVLAVGLGRFKVARPLQTVPYSRADVALLPDVEEAQAGEAAAAAGLASLRGDVSTSSAMAAAAAAARHAAAAGAEVWWGWEQSESRVLDRAAAIDGEDEAKAMEFGRRLVSIAEKEVVALPFYCTEDGGGGGGVPGEPTSAGGDAERRWRDGGALRDATLAAEAAAERAAAAFLAAVAVGLEGGEALLEAAAAAGSLLGANLVRERGVTGRSAAELLPEARDDPDAGLPDSLELALRLEAAVWVELDALRVLTKKINRWPMPMLPGLRCLRPPAAGDGGAAPGEGLPGAHPGYPALRRVQRLSFALASCLADTSVAEGRQAVLEAPSISSRLRLALASLRRQRRVLAAVAAVRDLKGDEG